MAAGKHMDKICIVAVVVALLIAILAMSAQGLGIQAAEQEAGYESRLFDTSRVHTIDIVMDDWDGFLTTCQSEEYSLCAAVIDGEAVHNVGIRGKGNTSLSAVASMDSDRYSFKLEFDQYDSTRSYYGLDKLSLNNLIQDNTMMKDYLVYRMMDAFGVNAPLCSFVYLTVNGEDWGLYLAVEGVEDSFLYRNYGSDYGELYKPDSMDMGGGRGNGREFDFSAMEEQFKDAAGEGKQSGAAGRMPPEGFNGGEGFDPSAMPGATAPEGMEMPDMQGGFGNKGGGIGSSDVKLQYIDDDPDSYSNIFGNAKTDITKADQTRLIQTLKALSAGDSGAVDVEQVLRYFVVHNYVVNGDSYTGSMVHNYYLYEKDGQLAMIPWDYNLAFGTFQGNNATSAVNDDIDSPLSAGTDRPMLAWIFADEESTVRYHSYFEEFLNSVDVQGIIDQAAALIAPYVEKDPTKFCTYEEFEAGVAALRAFCALRSQSVSYQLSGSGQTVDAADLNLSHMGTMGNTMGGDRQDFRSGTTVEPTEPSVTEPTEEGTGIVAVAEVESGTEESSGLPQFPGEMGGTPPAWGGEGQIPPGGMPDGEGTMPGGEMPTGGMPGMPSEGMEPMPSEGVSPGGLTPQEENSAAEPQESASENTQTFPSGSRGQMEGLQAMQPGVQSIAAQGSQWLLLGICAAVLLLGLLIAWRYRR